MARRRSSGFGRRLRLESLEGRLLLAADVAHNVVDPEDVDGDGFIAPRDALTVFNRLNRGTLAEGERCFADVNGDGHLSPVDGLLIVNRVNQGGDSGLSPALRWERLQQAIEHLTLPAHIDVTRAREVLRQLELRLAELRESLPDRIPEAPPTEAHPPLAGLQRRFEAWDQDGDGALTATEVSDAIWERLSQLDADTDGRLTLDEFRAGMESARPPQSDSPERPERPDRPALPEPPQRPERPEPPSRPDRPLPPLADFAHWDANGDGAVSADEVAEPIWERLSRADRDGDGGVTQEELRAYRPPASPGPFERVFTEYDTNNDGLLSADEVPEARWQWLARADANDDQLISLAEFKAVTKPKMPSVRDEAADGRR